MYVHIHIAGQVTVTFHSQVVRSILSDDQYPTKIQAMGNAEVTGSRNLTSLDKHAKNNYVIPTKLQSRPSI